MRDNPNGLGHVHRDIVDAIPVPDNRYVMKLTLSCGHQRILSVHTYIRHKRNKGTMFCMKCTDAMDIDSMRNTSCPNCGKPWSEHESGDCPSDEEYFSPYPTIYERVGEVMDRSMLIRWDYRLTILMLTADVKRAGRGEKPWGNIA